MDIKVRDRLESARAEVDAHINVIIELLLSNAEAPNEDVARLLMRVRSLLRSIRQVTSRLESASVT